LIFSNEIVGCPGIFSKSYAGIAAIISASWVN
jgi:hypothetical protein